VCVCVCPSFPNLGILHVTKKNVSKTLEERMVEAVRLGHSGGVRIHPDIDALQGEVRAPRDLTGQCVCVCVCACVCVCVCVRVSVSVCVCVCVCVSLYS